LVLTLLLVPSPAAALDKQGSAHGGSVGGDAQGFNVSGAALLGVSLYNPTYAARPDNTGIALFRYALHADIDVLGRALSFPLDVNMFTDKTRHGIDVLVPTELDLIAGVTTTFNAGPGAVELGSRIEHDMPLDKGTFTQTYVDTRARYLYSLASLCPGLGSALGDGDVSGWLTLGWFTANPTYAARPDNTGKALLRYAAHTEVSILGDLLSFGLDATFFTDRTSATSVIVPSELDLTPEIIGRIAPWELHLAYERDMPLDRGGLVQEFVYVVGVFGFDFAKKAPGPFLERGTISSP
jgi:hypothetical protein